MNLLNDSTFNPSPSRVRDILTRSVRAGFNGEIGLEDTTADRARCQLTVRKIKAGDPVTRSEFCNLEAQVRDWEGYGQAAQLARKGVLVTDDLGPQSAAGAERVRLALEAERRAERAAGTGRLRAV